MQQFSHLSDAELIKTYLSGQERALEVLIFRYKDKIYASIFMLVKDKFVAEDLFQDSFLKIVKTIREKRYSEQGKFLPWAIRIARNICMDHFRKVKADIPIHTEKGEDIYHLLPFATESADFCLERNQSHKTVRQLLEDLPEDQREVIVLRLYADLSFKEIAELTDVSINTSLGRMRYGLINLRKMIDKQELVLR